MTLPRFRAFAAIFLASALNTLSAQDETASGTQALTFEARRPISGDVGRNVLVNGVEGLLFQRVGRNYPRKTFEHTDAYMRVVAGSDSLMPYPLPYEGYDPEESRIRWDHAIIMGGAITVTVTAVHMYQMNAWWKDQRTAFHFTDDPAYALNVDKAGHFLGGAFCSFLGKKALEWSGASRGASAAWGSAIGALFELYVEFEDGFAKDWGFSPGDAYADIFGAAWVYGQYAIPYMEHLQPKFTYFPSQKYIDGLHPGNAIDDYEGQTYWLAVHVYGLLPKAWQRWWPSWLGFAIGTSVRNMDNPAQKERNILIALDYDMTHIVPGNSWFMRTFKEALNFLHFPSPAIRISPGFVGYGLYF